MKPKYTPDMHAVLRETDATRRRDRPPESSVASRPTPPGFHLAPEVARDIEEQLNELRAVQPAEEDGAAEVRVSAPSPWAKGGAGGIDKAALPSAMAPEGSERPVTKAVPEKAAAARGSWSWKVVLACAVACVCVTLVVVLAPREKEPRGAAPQEATAPPSATVTATPSAMLSVTAAPSATATAAAMPNANATATATSDKPSPSVVPAPGRPPARRVNQRSDGDPYDAAVSPPTAAATTAAPQVTATPSAVAPTITGPNAPAPKPEF